ncbi:MAG: M14 family metallocarboxypeptidase [Clostridia bacterium]|nr:M14 family metallocarboxypeptidase [Clostridia bacterium]
MSSPQYSYQTLLSDLSSLSKESPFFTFSSIGKSLVGRSLPLVIAGKGEKSVLYVGAHHAMESLTSLILIRFLSDYGRAIRRRESRAGIAAETLFEMRRIFVVPMLNPDGIELQQNGADPANPLTDRLNAMSGGDFRSWQANGRGVDLNHNYDAGFDAYKKKEPSLGIYGGGPTRFSGIYPESEPETAALCSFIRSRDVLLLLSLHTQGEEIYADYRGHVPPGGVAMAARMAGMSGYRVAEPEGPAASGGLKDWFILTYDRPGFTLECGKGKNPLPLSDIDDVYLRLRDVLFSCPTFL